MKTNLTTLQIMVDFLDDHLEEELTLDRIADEMGYSKYHLSRMFVNMVGFTIHQYVQRRRLSEAARSLVYTDQTILDIAYRAGYETQQSFTSAFKSIYHHSPQAYRKKQTFYPLQLKFKIDGKDELRGDRVMEIRTVEEKEIKLVGYQATTRLGFFSIGTCWHKVHAKKGSITNRTDMDFLIGVNDYTNWNLDADNQPAFDYFAGAQVYTDLEVPRGMERKTLPSSMYIVFRFHAKNQDSLQPVADYIYKEWFPQSTCQLNEHARYDFAKYGEQMDAAGKSLIEYWIPIL